MKIIDKKSVLMNLDADRKVRLELGCGRQKKHVDAIGIDAIDYPCVDIVGDIFDVLQKISDETIHEIYSYHFFEHVENLSKLVNELERVLVKKGKLMVVVPHFSSPYYYSDYTHKNQFGLYSFSYFASDSIFSRKIPTYEKSPVFNLIKVTLIFKSPIPFYFRWLWKKMFQYIFNLNNYMKELYEENFCYFIPCYEIKYEMMKTFRD